MDSKKQSILIADDEPDILEIISYNLSKEGYEVITAKDGNEAIRLAVENNPQLLILDILMPYKSGMEVCQYLRMQPEFKETLIIFLTALNDEAIHVRGLENGADDYITKPISPKVLVSRVNALFRRLKKQETVMENKLLEIYNVVIDPVKFTVKVGDNEVLLAKKEFELLYLLASQPGRVFLRNEILNKVWGADVIVGDRTIDVHIRKIRQKMQMDCITTVKGVGYKFEL